MDGDGSWKLVGDFYAVSLAFRCDGFLQLAFLCALVRQMSEIMVRKYGLEEEHYLFIIIPNILSR